MRPIGEIAEELGREVGFVRLGAFVVEREPNEVRNGQRTRTVTAYLPVGTPVFLSNCDILIREGASLETSVSRLAPSAAVQPYCDIVTSLGIGGLVRKEQVTLMEGGRFAIAVADAPAEVLSAAGDQSVGSFSRTSGVYVEVVGESAEYYNVRMPWSQPPNVEGRLRKASQERQTYVYLDEMARFAEPVEFRSVAGEVAGRLRELGGARVSHLVDQLSRGLESISSDLDGLANLQCITAVTVDFQAGMEIFGNGLGLQASASLFETGYKYEAAMEVMFSNNRPLQTVIVLKKLRCETILIPYPVEMTAFGLFGDRSPAEGNRFLFSSTAAASGRLLAVPDTGVSPPMFRIRNWNEYERAVDELLRAMEDNKWLSSLRPGERDVLLHYVLEQVAAFSSGD